LKPVVIIGGGIAGLIAANVLAQKGVQCVVIERKVYPMHRVCGEYISNEATPFLESLGLFPEIFNPPQITRFLLSSLRGKSETLPLGTGGFGISRYEFDNFLYNKARSQGVEFLLNTEVTDVEFENQHFRVITPDQVITSPAVLAAYGKRSRLDIQMNRKFTSSRSPFVAVKYHVAADYPSDLISLHNFPGGYCGINKVENNTVNVCYLSHRDNFKKHKTIDEIERRVLFSNPRLKESLANATPLWEKPEVINEITFTSKTPIENHMLMIGDSAGMIAPLCGNGMAIAIHGAKLACGIVISFMEGRIDRVRMEEQYRKAWTQHFSTRLLAGRTIQKLFGSSLASTVAIGLALYNKPLARFIIRNTHGNAF
jgi:flavin-dependent dehydrogenase